MLNTGNANRIASVRVVGIADFVAERSLRALLRRRSDVDVELLNELTEVSNRI